jgi:hypothetical protein
VKFPVAVSDPPDVIIDTAPVTAPGITNATKLVPVLLMIIADWPPIDVVTVPLFKFVPVIVTKLPTGPLAGVKDVIVGIARV